MNHFKLIPLEERIVFDGAAAAHILYVNASAHSGGNGLSWGSAFNDLQTAINTADHLTGSTQIWVAKGTYTPDAVPSNPSSATFLINDSNPLAIYGGFNVGATSLSQSNPAANPTILNGVLSGGGNVDTIVTINQGTITLDGLTITGANNPSGLGGGVLQNSGTLTVSQDTFTNDVASSSASITLDGITGVPIVGGSIASFNSNLTITHSLFSTDIAGGIVGVSVVGDSNVSINSNVFKGNILPGAELSVLLSQNVNISSNTLSDNNVYIGILLWNNNNLTINSNNMENNTGYEIISTYVNNNISFTNNNLSGNVMLGFQADGYFTGSDTNLLISNNIFSDNSATDPITHQGFGGVLAPVGDGTVIITDNIFINNTSDYGGAIYSAYNNSITITDNLFQGNKANVAGGAICSGSFASLAGAFDVNINISQNIFTNNTSGDLGGAVATNGDLSLTLNQNVFISNKAAYGGAINDGSSIALSITDDVFAGNSATQGDSIWLDGGQTTINGLTVLLTPQTALIAQLVNNNVALFNDEIYIG